MKIKCIANRRIWMTLLSCAAVLSACGHPYRENQAWESLFLDANTALAEEDMPRAEQLFEKCTVQAERIPSPDIRYVVSLDRLAELRVKENKIDSAKELYKRAVAACQRVRQAPSDELVDKEMARSFVGYAQLFEQEGKLDQAADLYEKAIALDQACPQSEESGDRLLADNFTAAATGLASIRAKQLHFAQAETLYRLALEHKSLSDIRRIEIISSLAAVLEHEGKREEANALISQLHGNSMREALSKTLDSRLVAAQKLATDEHAPERAITLLKESLKAADSLDQHDLQRLRLLDALMSYEHMAGVKFNADAEVRINQALQCMNGMNNPDDGTLREMDNTLHTIAGFYRQSPLKMRPVLEKQLKLREDLRGPKSHNVAEILLSLASVDISLHDYAIAEQRLNRALDIWSVYKDGAEKRHISETVSLLYQCYMRDSKQELADQLKRKYGALVVYR